MDPTSDSLWRWLEIKAVKDISEFPPPVRPGGTTAHFENGATIPPLRQRGRRSLLAPYLHVFNVYVFARKMRLVRDKLREWSIITLKTYYKFCNYFRVDSVLFRSVGIYVTSATPYREAF